MNDVIVIYHGNCPDGFCAAHVLRDEYPNAEFVPATYGMPRPSVRLKTVFLLDFSFPREDMLAMADEAVALITLDHHATAQDALKGFDAECLRRGNFGVRTIFDMGKSGARLTWEWSHPDAVNISWLVQYVEDRDLWRFALPHSREVNAVIRSHPMDFATWDSLSTIPNKYVNWDMLCQEGAAILRREQQIIAEHVARAQTIILGGYAIPAVNATTLFSDIAGELAQDAPFAVAYFRRADGQYQWSLRSADGGLDVAVIAKTFGGGGHPHAAGFTSPTLDVSSINPWDIRDAQ